jgi:hypothetical protein
VLDLSGWLTGMRVIVRAERPHPGAQLRFTDVHGNRLTAFATNTTRGQLADLKLRHRRRARCDHTTTPPTTQDKPTTPRRVRANGSHLAGKPRRAHKSPGDWTRRRLRTALATQHPLPERRESVRRVRPMRERMGMVFFRRRGLVGTNSRAAPGQIHSIALRPHLFNDENATMCDDDTGFRCATSADAIEKFGRKSRG